VSKNIPRSLGRSVTRARMVRPFESAQPQQKRTWKSNVLVALVISIPSANRPFVPFAPDHCAKLVPTFLPVLPPRHVINDCAPHGALTQMSSQALSQYSVHSRLRDLSGDLEGDASFRLLLLLPRLLGPTLSLCLGRPSSRCNNHREYGEEGGVRNRGAVFLSPTSPHSRPP
jgi:hypothetical protein